VFAHPELLAKYNQRVPRYTSYPTALQFTPAFTNDSFVKAAQSNHTAPVSLYVHIPFCRQLCYYCGCNKVVTRHQHKADDYLDALEKEMQTHSEWFNERAITSIHFGGGSPNFLNQSQTLRLFAMLRRYFSVSEYTDISVECDPRWLDEAAIDTLYEEGATRLSMGIQDTNIEVQKAINRVQDTQRIGELVGYARQRGIKLINLDLIYGLPFQSQKTFATTLNDIVEMNPDRVSLFNYAHLPERFAAQRKIRSEWLPSLVERLGLMQQAHKYLSKAGYVAIGLDHFAKPTDTLYEALQQGTLNRNFQGYVTESTDILGLGVSAISQIEKVFVQNSTDLKDYETSANATGNAHAKGCQLTEDDLIRRYVISELMCNLHIDKPEFFNLFGIVFDDYFADELNSLLDYQEDGIVQLGKDNITIPEDCRLFARNICSCFDAYLPLHSNTGRFSKAL
jgi:oxygen-independent coproporphyrinogen-3 oxidase